MKRLLLATACALLCVGLGVKLTGQLPTGTIGPIAQIHPPPENYSFPNGQVLVYEAEWRLWTAGTARITVEPAGALSMPLSVPLPCSVCPLTSCTV